MIPSQSVIAILWRKERIGIVDQSPGLAGTRASSGLKQVITKTAPLHLSIASPGNLQITRWS
jgi:hypothetical protein